MVLARFRVPLADARLQRARSAPRPIVPPRRAMPARRELDFNYVSVNLRPCEVTMYASVFTVCSLLSYRQAALQAVAAQLPKDGCAGGTDLERREGAGI